MTTQHLSDEAVAAFADGVLRGHAHERATRHCAVCAECASAVRGQREAVLALRAAALPHLPSGLADRLRTLPQTTPIRALPTVVGDDGTLMVSTRDLPPRRRGPASWMDMLAAPAAALVAPEDAPTDRPARHGNRHGADHGSARARRFRLGGR